MRDIVDRLLAIEYLPPVQMEALKEASDEIQRLRAERDALAKALQTAKKLLSDYQDYTMVEHLAGGIKIDAALAKLEGKQ